MFHVKNEDTDTPEVDYVTGKATVRCDVCDLEKAEFPLGAIAKFNGSGFLLSTEMFGCGCGYLTVYTLRGPEPMAQILTKLSGFNEP